MAQTQKIKMAGRSYTFVDQLDPEMDGHDNRTVGHLRNSRNEFAGYVVVMTGRAAGARLLLGGPSGISRDAERRGLAEIELETKPETVEEIDELVSARSVVVIYAPDRSWRLRVRKSDGILPGNRAVGAWVVVEDDETESYVYLRPGSTGVLRKGKP